VRRPTIQHVARLSLLADPRVMVLAPRKLDWGPLLRRGLVEPAGQAPSDKFLPPLQITAAGLRELADRLDDLRVFVGTEESERDAA